MRSLISSLYKVLSPSPGLSMGSAEVSKTRENKAFCLPSYCLPCNTALMKPSLSALCLCLGPKSTQMWGREWRRELGQPIVPAVDGDTCIDPVGAHARI